MGDLLNPEVAKILPAVLVILAAVGVTVGGLIISALRGYGWLRTELATITALIGKTLKDHEAREEARFDGFDRKLDAVKEDVADVRALIARIDERTK
jgi:hypothetical protein